MISFNFFKKLFIRQKEENNIRETLSELITNDSEEKPSLNEQEKALLTNILALREITVEDMMIPRADMVALPIDTTYEEAIALVKQSSYSRFPIYGEQLDDIRGFIHIRDIVAFPKNGKFDCSKIMYRLLFVPASMPVMDLLLKMREAQIPIAIVVDEFGGTDGLVTAWDIMHEILGDIDSPEQTEDTKAKLIKEEDGSYLVDARLPIENLEGELGLLLTDDETEEEVDTVGGLVLYLAGRVPDRKEVIDHSAGVEFEIVEATPRTVLKVRVTKKHHP